MNLTSECFALMTERLLSVAGELCGGRLVMCQEGGYSTTYVPYCGLAILEQMSGERTGVADPWISDARRVHELPLRAHEQQAVQTAVLQHAL
jgi:acetoin utilization deacetylase AcuC-like enzyme